MSRVPRPIPGCDIRSLPLRPSEAFLFTRIDGVASERDLTAATGLSLAQVAEAVDRLAELGAISVAGAESGPRARMSQSRMAAEDAGRPGGPRTATPMGRPAIEPASESRPLYDPAELDEDVEIERTKRRRILDVFYRLEDMSYYELLGVPQEADKKQIKSAYYALAPEFHPDKYFRKKLGSYKPKIEAVFTRITLAHDVLTTKARRAEYDAYIEQIQKNRVMAALIEQTPRDVATVVAAVNEAAAAILDGAQPGRYASQSKLKAVTPASAPVLPLRPESAQSRRETLARKLAGGALADIGAAARSVPQPPQRSGPEAAVVALRSRYEGAIGEAKRQQLVRFRENAKLALEKKDYAAAANAFRIAASLDPDDAELQSTCQKAQQLAAMALADGYFKQAEYEAGQDRWADAALSYTKVINGRPDDAAAHERAALAVLKSSGNTRRSVELARRAVELAPSKAEYRLTLAQAYASAGLEKSALGELDRATELAAGDARLVDQIAKLRLGVHT